MKLEITQDPYMNDPDPKKRIDVGLFRAITVLYREGWFVSCLKLLVSAIDTFACLDSKNGRTSKKRFCDWLDTYADLSKAGITPEELYQHRCALLHTTTLDSDAVKQRTVHRLIPYKKPASPRLIDKTSSEWMQNSKFFEIIDLVMAIGDGVDEYCDMLEKDPVALARFNKNWENFVFDRPAIRVKPKNRENP